MTPRPRPSRLSRVLWRDLRHLAPQFAAIALTTAAGAAVFVALRSMQGWMRDARDGYYASGHFGEVFAHATAVPPDVVGQLAALPGVASAHGRVVRDVLVDVPGLQEPATGRFVSLADRGESPVNRVLLVAGRWPAAGADADVVLSRAFADANALAPGDTVHAILAGRRRALHVAGIGQSPEFIYEIRGGTDLFPDSRRFGVVWMPAAALGDATGLGTGVNDIVLRLATRASAADVIAAVDARLAAFGGTGAYDRRAHVSHVFVSSEIDEVQVTGTILPGLFLAVTAFLLHTVLGRLVSTQREQIALLKAFGFSDARIGRHYVVMAGIPVLVGTAAGLALGLWLATLLATVYERFFQFPSTPFAPRPAVLLVAAGISAAMTTAGSLLAVRAAVRLPPAEAMRPPVPARFGGRRDAARWLAPLGPAAHGVVRQVLRRPARSAATVAGEAAAIGLLVVVLFTFAAITRLRDVAMGLAARETVAVGFAAPQPPAVRHELARLPGVHRVELVAMTPVTLRHGARDVRTALERRPPDAELRRILRPDGASAALPRAGLLLSTTLAARLDVQPGDSVVAMLRDGSQHTRRLEVAGVVEELLGLGAYLAPETYDALPIVHRGLADAALLAADPEDEPMLAHALKARPGVATATFRRSAIAGFDATIAESFRPSLIVAVIFAALVVGGVVFNGARIALSERGRELASLRILGFGLPATAAFLLGEQALLLLAALPVGSLVGVGLCRLVVERMTDTDVFRLPLFVDPIGHAWAWGIAVAAGALTAVAVVRRLARWSLIDVLKTRE